MPDNEWYTPWSIVQPLADEFAGGQFDLDPCATPESSKGVKFFTVDDDGLEQGWFGKVWMNPPYSVGQPAKWIQKSLTELEKGNAELVIALMQSRTETKWFQKAMHAASVMRFPAGRIEFEKPDGSTGHNRFGNTIFVLRSNHGR